MAIKLEKVVEKFYLGLEEGKILGRKCPKCGNVEFPPVYACNACGNYETEWVEISGKAKLHSIVLPAALSSKPEYKKFKKFCYGVVLGVSKKNRKELAAKLPLDIHAKIVERDIGVKTVVFELDEN